jgi:hypothetical protein
MSTHGQVRSHFLRLISSTPRTSLRTFAARRLAGGDLEILGREADRPLDRQTLGPSALNQLAADFLERCNLAAGQGDADAVRLGRLAMILLDFRHLFPSLGSVTTRAAWCCYGNAARMKQLASDSALVLP